VNREQRGVFVARATTIDIADHGCAWEGLSMNRDSSAGAVHGLGKRGRTVGMTDHGCAGDSRQDDSSAVILVDESIPLAGPWTVSLR